MKNNTLTWARLVALIAFVAGFASCDSDSDNEPITPQTNSVWVVNQGNFGDIGSLDVYYPDSNRYVSGVYQAANGEALPGIIESFTWLNNEEGVLVTNLVDALIFVNEEIEEQDRIVDAERLTTPRYVATSSNNLYVSVWGPFTNPTAGDYSLKESTIAVFDVDTRTFSQEVSVDGAPEKLELVGDNLWIAPRSYDAGIIRILNTSTLLVDEEITFNEAVTQMVAGTANDIWVVSGNKVLEYNGLTTQKISEYSLSSGQIKDIQLTKNSLYASVTNDGGSTMSVVEIDLQSQSAEATTLFTREAFDIFYVDKANEQVYVGSSPINAPGTLTKLSWAGAELATYPTGIYLYDIFKTTR
jgi:hypothetical protein